MSGHIDLVVVEGMAMLSTIASWLQDVSFAQVQPRKCTLTGVQQIKGIIQLVALIHFRVTAKDNEGVAHK